MARRAFFSYAREDAQRVAELEAQLQQLGYDVWLDRVLKGGQSWWEEILEQIRRCDVFVAAVSPASLDSLACARERRYAEQLDRPILPVALAAVNQAVPNELARRQMVDYKVADANAAFALMSALGTLPSAPPLPKQLPSAPDVPLSYLAGLVDLAATPEELDRSAQMSMINDLEPGLRAPDLEERAGAWHVLQLLEDRPDLLADTQRRIDGLRQRYQDRAPPEYRRPAQPAAQTPTPSPTSPQPVDDQVDSDQASSEPGEGAHGRSSAAAQHFASAPPEGSGAGVAVADAARGRQRRTWLIVAAVLGVLVVLGAGVGVASLLADGDDEPVTYGDDSELDALWDSCAEGDPDACFDLYEQSPAGSEYESFGDTCGETTDGGGCAFSYGDDSDLDALWDSCAEGDPDACFDLYEQSPAGSEYESFGDTCGDTTDGGGCAFSYGDDPDLDALWDSCADGDFAACFDLYEQSPAGSEYESFGDTCGDTTEGGGCPAGRARPPGLSTSIPTLD